MKKIMTGIMSLSLMGMLAIPVQAETTSLSYSQSSSYTLKIPATLVLKGTTSESLAIGVSVVNTLPSEKLQVKATGGIDASGNTTLARTGGGSTSVKVTTASGGSTGITTSTSLAEFMDQSTTATSGGTIYFAAVGNVNAGTYTGTITFTGSMVSR